jgi:hypothetical protein
MPSGIGGEAKCTMSKTRYVPSYRIHHSKSHRSCTIPVKALECCRAATASQRLQTQQLASSNRPSQSFSFTLIFSTLLESLDHTYLIRTDLSQARTPEAPPPAAALAHTRHHNYLVYFTNPAISLQVSKTPITNSTANMPGLHLKHKRRR